MGIKKINFMGIAILLFLVASTAQIYSRSLTGQLDLVSSFIFRGMDLNPDHKPVVQPQLTYVFGASGFSANIFTSFSFEHKELNEIDLTLAYDYKVSEGLALSCGVIHYGWYMNDGFTFKDNTTFEVYAGVALPNVPLSPKITLYYDFNMGDGLYAELSLLHSIKVNETLNADFSATLGYNAGQWLPENADTGLSDLTFGVAFPFKVGKVTLVPYANYTFVFLDAISTKNHFWAGLSLII